MDATMIPFAFPGIADVACAFQTRTGGLGKGGHAKGNISLDVGDDPDTVISNRNSLRKQLGFTAWQELSQVHGTQVIFDPEPGDIQAPGSIEADGLATTRPGQALVVKTADCQPILLAHKGGRHIAALHAGWRGNKLRFPRLGVRAFCEEYELDPAEVMAVRGPSLGPSASEFVNFSEEFGEDFRPYYDQDSKTVNLWRLTGEQLLAAGLKKENIFRLDLCTWSLPEMFFSYRRDKVCGRQASIIWIRPNAA